MELRDYVRLLRLHWRGVVAIVVACVLIGVGYTLTRSAVYTADAHGYITTSKSDDNTALASVNDSLAKSKAPDYLRVATQRPVAEEVISELGLTTTPDALINRITVTHPADTSMLEIKADAGSPEEAQQLADAWVTAVTNAVQTIEDPEQTGSTPLRIVAIESAALPTSPSAPDPVRNIGLALLLGVLLGLAYAIIRGTFDRRLRSKEDIEEKFDVAVVGQIPDANVLKRDDAGHSLLAVDADNKIAGQIPTSEAFRRLRTNLTYMDVDNPPRVIVVASPMPGDGKSTVSSNLVAAIERSGQPVVLIDGDLRRPMVAKALGLVEGVGLTDVLTGKLPVEEALQRIPGHDNLRVLAAGSIPPNPSELLSSQAMRNLLARLSQSAIVVIDAPPLLPVTDGAILAQRADGALIVVSANKTKDHHLESALESLQRVDARTLGVIVNRVPKRGKVMGYGNYGNYGYGNYGYEAYYQAVDAETGEAVQKRRKRAEIRK